MRLDLVAGIAHSGWHVLRRLKILGFFVVPSNAVAMLCALGALLLLTRFRKAGSRLLGLGVLLMLVCGYSSLGNLLLLP